MNSNASTPASGGSQFPPSGGGRTSEQEELDAWHELGRKILGLDSLYGGADMITADLARRVRDIDWTDDE